ncbi:MAG: asparaginase [Firmicutes bacterium]|nr:asparaginase [Bacillota bacterium]
MKKRILIIDNGGTVSMKRFEGVLQPVDGKEEILSLIYRIKRPVEIHYEKINSIDSSNLHPGLMKPVFNAIASNYKDYDGFVVLTGTDTLAYLSSFLSFWLEEIHKPVVITGSQKPLNELGSDAPGNIYYSIMFSCEDIPEVTVFFGKHLFRGNRVTKADSQGFDAFDSPNFLPLGHVDALHHEIHSPLESALRPNEKERFRFAWSDKAAMIPIHPGMKPELLGYLIKSGYRAVILEAYGMGNLPFEGPYSLEQPVKLALDSGVIICVVTRCYKGGVRVEYETARRFLDLGALFLRDITREAAYSKLSWLLGLYENNSTVRELMLEVLCGEMNNRSAISTWKIDY